jgi:hypothetical protein
VVGWRGEAREDPQVPLPRPFPLAFQKQRKMEAEEEPGKGAKRQGPQRRERSGWQSRGRRWLRRPSPAGGSPEASDRGRGGGGRDGGPRPAGGSQRKERAPRPRYLCSKRPSGSRGLQQFHLDLLRHRRRRCGRRLRHVALDHWRKVGSKQSSQPLAASPFLRALAPSPLPSRGPPRDSGRAARRSAPGLGSQCAGRGWAIGKATRAEPGGGGWGAAGWRGEGLSARCSGAGGGDAKCGSAGEGPRQEGGRSGSASQGEARRKARVTSHRQSRKVPPRGLRPSPCASPWHTRWKVFKATKAKPGAREVTVSSCGAHLLLLQTRILAGGAGFANTRGTIGEAQCLN